MHLALSLCFSLTIFTPEALAANVLWTQYCQHLGKMKLLVHLDSDPTATGKPETVKLWLRDDTGYDWGLVQSQPVDRLTATALFVMGCGSLGPSCHTSASEGAESVSAPSSASHPTVVKAITSSRGRSLVASMCKIAPRRKLHQSGASVVAGFQHLFAQLNIIVKEQRDHSCVLHDLRNFYSCKLCHNYMLNRLILESFIYNLILQLDLKHHRP